MRGSEMATDHDEYDPSTDIIYGAQAIAGWLGKKRRQVFYLHSIKSGVPFFKTGSTICLSKAAYMAWARDGKKLNK
jgi:hypothetical protein